MLLGFLSPVVLRFVSCLVLVRQLRWLGELAGRVQL